MEIILVWMNIVVEYYSVKSKNIFELDGFFFFFFMEVNLENLK